MKEPYTYVADLRQQEIPADGILSRTLHNDDQVKVVLFAFAPGQELSEHTASMPAMLSIIQGEATVTLGTDTLDAHPGAWVYMPAHLRHAVRAKTPVVMQLVLVKQR